MPDNDGRDPLDSWLRQQVRPLPPPPGTFEMISRRARRRKARKLAVTVISAAAVAAGVAVAVPGVTSLHLGTPGESGNTVADGRSNAAAGGANGTSGLNGNGSRTATSSPAAPTPSTGTSGPAAGPVPAGFAPASVTFVSPTDAWVIGQAGTPGRCYNGDVCTSVAWTSDDGAAWHGEHAPVAGAPSGPDGVSGIRFLDGVNGWAFGPELWVTHDSGNTWTRISTDGLRVTDLETAGDRAYALFAMCSGTSAPGFAADCTSYTLMTSLATSNAWTPVGGATNGLTRNGGAASAMLALTRTEGYLVAPDGTLYSGPLGGTWSKAGTLPCQPSFPPQADGLPASGMLALENATGLAVACDGGPSATSQPAIYTSDDGGATWTEQASAAWSGVSVPESSMTSLAAAPDGTLLLSTTGGIYVLPAGGSSWQAATARTGSPGSAGSPGSPGSAGSSGSPGLPAGGFSYVGMTTDTQGVAIPANSSLDEIWLTADGGLTWSPSPIAG